MKRGEGATKLGVLGCLHGCLQLCEDRKALEVGAAPILLHPGPLPWATWCFIFREARGEAKAGESSGAYDRTETRWPGAAAFNLFLTGWWGLCVHGCRLHTEIHKPSRTQQYSRQFVFL